MAKLTVSPGTTSQTIELFIQDSSSTTGAGLTGLVFNSAGLTAYYHREGAAAPATAISLVTATVGTWTSGGFKEIDATNMPGHYELGVPDAALAASAGYVDIHLEGATNMAPVPAEIQLVASGGDVNVTQWKGQAVPTPSVTGVPKVDPTHWLGTALATPDTAGYVKATIKDGAGTGELDLNSGVVQSDPLAQVVESGLDIEEVLRIILAATSGITTNDGTRFRDVADSKNRINATVVGKNRTAVTRDGS